MIKASEYCLSVFDGTHESPKPAKSGYKLLTSKNILNGYIDDSDAYFISEQDYNAINERSKVLQWDILFSMIGTVGNICLITEDNIDFAIKNMGVFSTRNEDKAKWFYFYLKSPTVKRKIQNQLNGAVQKFLTLGWLRNLEIPEYKDDKKRIVDLLWSLEKKISINNSINLELESMIETIYDYWFLQFEFPNEDGKPYKSSGGKMVWNNKLKRDIPEGWKATEILELVDWITNSQPPKSEFKYSHEDGYIRFIQNRDYDSDSYYTYVHYRKSMNKVGRLDILIDKYGDAGLVRYGIEGVFNVALAQIRPKNNFMREYVRSILLSNSMYKYLHNACMASTRASLNENNFKLLFIAEPPMNIVKQFERIVVDMRWAILKKNDENEKLKSLRDFLLPLLFNGQVTFKDSKL